MMRELYVAHDRESTYLKSQNYLQRKYAAYASRDQATAMPGNESFSGPYQDLAPERFLLGSPDDVAEEMLPYSDKLAVNYLIFRMQWPGMGQPGTPSSRIDGPRSDTLGQGHSLTH